MAGVYLTSKLMGISSGKQGIIDTLKIMRRTVRQGKIKLSVRTTALFLVQNLLQKDYENEVRTIWDFVKNRIRYTRDINDVETIQTPDKTLELKAGDCDDKSILLASLLESIGHRTRFIAIAVYGENYCHVYVQVFLNGHWLNLETTEDKNIGWQPEKITAKLVIDNSDDSEPHNLAGNFFKKMFKVATAPFTAPFQKGNVLKNITSAISAPVIGPIELALGKSNAFTKIAQAPFNTLNIAASPFRGGNVLKNAVYDLRHPVTTFDKYGIIPLGARTSMRIDKFGLKYIAPIAKGVIGVAIPVVGVGIAVSDAMTARNKALAAAKQQEAEAKAALELQAQKEADLLKQQQAALDAAQQGLIDEQQAKLANNNRAKTGKINRPVNSKNNMVLIAAGIGAYFILGNNHAR